MVGIERRATGPHGQRSRATIHDRWVRQKRDGHRRGSRVVLLHKRRFQRVGCRRTFPGPETTGGMDRRTTARLRTTMGRQGCQHPVAQGARDAQVGPRVVPDGVQAWAQREVSPRHRTSEERGLLPTPRLLGRDAFARRKGPVSETLLWDPEARWVLEGRERRQQEEVARLLERLEKPDVVEAVIRERSPSVRAAVQSCLPQAQVVVDPFPVRPQVMKGFQMVVSRWAHQPASQALREGKPRRFLRAKEEVTTEQAQERAPIGAPWPQRETAWQ